MLQTVCDLLVVIDRGEPTKYTQGWRGTSGVVHVAPSSEVVRMPEFDDVISYILYVCRKAGVARILTFLRISNDHASSSP